MRALSVFRGVMVAAAVATVPCFAQAQSLVVVCDCLTNKNFAQKTYFIDLKAKTIRHTSPMGAQYGAYTVTANITEDRVSWSWSGTTRNLDRYSGAMIQDSPPAVFNWQCKKTEQRTRAIE